MESQNILRKYIESIIKLQEENKNAPLNLEELNHLHEELGLSAEDLNFIDKKFTDYFQRGLGFIRYQDWNRAIQELEQAVVLKPLHIEILYRLAEAYQGRSIKNRNIKDKQKALYYAERCLQSDAQNERALYLISQLRRNVSNKQRQQSYIKLVMAALALLILSLGGYLIWREYRKNSTSPQEAVQDHTLEEKSPASVIPVNIFSDSKSAGFELALESSFLGLQSQKKFYQIRASLINSKYDISYLEINILLKNQRNEILKKETITLLSENDEELSAGDALPFSKTLPIDANPAQTAFVDIAVSNLRRAPSVQETEDSREIDVNFISEKLQEKQVSIQERYQTITPQADFFDHEIILQFTNHGKDYIYLLKAEIQWFDQAERQVFSKQITLVNSGEPALMPKHRRRLRLTQQIPVKIDNFNDYKIIIVNAQ